MVVKIYVSGISGNKEVKKRQQRVLMILDSRNFKYEVVDIAEPGNEEEKDFMQNNSTSLGATVGDASPRHPLPPQIFNDKIYCGDYDQFDMSNEIDELEKFLKMAPDDSATTITTNAEIKLGNGNAEPETIGAKEMIEETKAAESPISTNENAAAKELEKLEEAGNKSQEAAPMTEINNDANIENGEGEKETSGADES